MMVDTSNHMADRLVFYRFLPHFLGENCLWLGIGYTFATMLRTHKIVGLIGCLIVCCVAVLRIRHYNAGLAIIHGPVLTVRQGFLFIRETHMPIWQMQFQIEQHMLNRICGYATVILSTDTSQIRIRAISAFDLLQLMIMERQQTLNLLLDSAGNARDTRHLIEA